MTSTPPAGLAAPAVPPPAAIPMNAPEIPPPVPPPSVSSESPATESNQQAPLRQQEASFSTPIPIFIPSYSRWFSWSKIHETERRILPEFFDSKSPSRNPRAYKYYRNSIVRKYRENPSRKITFTEIRRTIIGDVGSVRRVFDFLENWGLINHTSARQNLKWEDKESKSGAATSIPGSAGGTQSGTQKKEGARKVCDGCKSVISIACFSCTKIDFILCARCFVRGNYGVGLTHADFKRVDIHEEPTKTDWTDKETLHLLEALLHYGDDWKKVAEHVGSRSKRECVIRFLKLPFSEQLMGTLNGDEISNYGVNSTNHPSNAEEGCENAASECLSKNKHLTPLADTSNPIMAQAAFLSALVGSNVAKAAAQAAITALSDQDRTDLENYLTEEIDMEGAANDDNIERPLGWEVTEAREMLEKEKQEVERSISHIINVQMKEIQEKIVNFERLELDMEKERAELYHMKDMLLSDQLCLQHRRDL